MHYQNLFRLFINSKIRKVAIQIFIETVLKAQENQRFSILTKLKTSAIKHNRLTINYLRFDFIFLHNALKVELKKINFNRERKTIKNKNKFVENKKNHIFAT